MLHYLENFDIYMCNHVLLLAARLCFDLTTRVYVAFDLATSVYAVSDLLRKDLDIATRVNVVFELLQGYM